MIRKKTGPTARARAAKRRKARATIAAVRAAVVERAAGCCESCGVWLGEDGHAHHIVPRSLGGLWTEANIRYACLRCHMSAHRLRVS